MRRSAGSPQRLGDPRAVTDGSLTWTEVTGTGVQQVGEQRFLGSDSLPSDDLHQFHEGDTYNPVEPAAFLTRLQTVGFAAITLHVSYHLVFIARKQ